MSLFSSKRVGVSVALDVGSHSIKGLIFEPPKAGKFPQPTKRLASQISFAYDVPRVVEELHKMITGVIKELGRIPEKVSAGFGASLADCVVESWKVDEEVRANISQRDLVNYFNKLFAARQKEGRAMIATPVAVMVNSYAVPSAVFRKDGISPLFLLGGSVRDLCFQTVVSYVPSEIGTVLGAIKEMLGGVPVEFVPLVVAYQEAIAGRLGVRDALLVDIGGMNTMVVLLKAGMLSECVSFPVGYNHVTQEISRGLGVPFESADEMMSQYIKGLATEKIRTHMRPYLDQAVQLWNRCFHEGLNALYHAGALSGEVLVCGGGAYLPEFQSILRGKEWLKDFSYRDTPQVTLLEGKSFFKGDALGGFVQGIEDAGLAAVMWYSLEHQAIL